MAPLIGEINPSVLTGDLGVHHSIHHSMLPPPTLILIKILQTRCYYTVSQMEKKKTTPEFWRVYQLAPNHTTSNYYHSNPGLLALKSFFFQLLIHLTPLDSFILLKILPIHSEDVDK